MPSHSKFVGMVACSAGAYTISQAFTSVSAPRSAVSSPASPAARGVSANGPLHGSVCGAACAVSGTVLAVGAFQAGSAVSKRRAKVRVMALSQDDELAFTPGQQVTLLAPPAMAGKQGTVVGPDLGESFKVQLATGSIFSIATENIQGGAVTAPARAVAAAATPVASAPVAFQTAAAPANDDEELEFAPGQRVTVLAPPALAGKPGTVVGPALGNSFAVQLESGSIFNIVTENIQDAAAPAPVPAARAPVAATAPQVSSTAQDDEELEFTPGQRVTLIAPPAMAGKQGTIVGPALGESFAVQLESGSIFNVATQNIQDAAAPAPPQAAATAASPVVAAPAQDDEELEFTPGQQVTILAPPALAGKQGTVVRPALGESFAVQLESGSIFNIATENIQDAAAPAPPRTAAAASAPIAAASVAAQDDEELEFTPGQRVAILAPPALAGRQGTIVGPALGETFKVQLDSGSIFNITTENIQDAAAPAAPRAATAAARMPAAAAAPMPAPAAVAVSTSQSEEAEFEKGQVVSIIAPPALAGKQGTIGGPDYAENWMVVLESGSVFSLKAQNLKPATVGA